MRFRRPYDAQVHNGVLYVVGQAGVAAWTTSSGALTPVPGMPFVASGESANNPTFIEFSQ